MDSLKTIPDDLWFQSFREGSWGIVDVIAHFISWDRFIIENRILYVLKNEPFSKMGIDVEDINRAASQYARSGIMKDQLIITVIARLQQISAEQLNNTLETPILGCKTFGELACVTLMHEAAHMGQIQAMKRIIEHVGVKN